MCMLVVSLKFSFYVIKLQVIANLFILPFCIV